MKLTKLFATTIIALTMLTLIHFGLVKQQAWAEKAAKPEMSPTQVVTVSGCLNSGQFQAVIDEFSTRTGITVQYDENCDKELIRSCTDNNDCSDVAIGEWHVLLEELGKTGTLIDLSTFISTTMLTDNYNDTWIDLGEVENILYGVWFSASNKSLVWYDPGEFSSNGWSIPTTWTEMIALSEEISNTTGTAPWSIGNESNAATGWPLTDWFENILLRSAGPEVYDDLTAHNIPWTHNDVKSAMIYFGELFGNQAYQLGGKSGTLDTSFIDALIPPFEDPPGAYLSHQGHFAQNFIESQFPAQIPGIDYSIFPFPDISSTYTSTVMGQAAVTMMFNNSPEAQSFINFLITTDAAEIWISQGNINISPNRNADTNLYADPNTRAAAEQLINAETYRFDLTDQLPNKLNLYIWSQMDDLVLASPDQEAMEEVLARIEFRASHPFDNFLPLIVGGSD